jgi:hypothetical protein
MLLVALSALTFLTSAPAASFSLDALAQIFATNSPRSLEAALPLLPSDFRRDAVLMSGSRSLQNSSPDEPRAILSNTDGSFVLAFNGDGSTFEMVQYHADTHHFEFAEADFYFDRAPEITRSPSICAGCHGNGDDPHPVWESFPTFLGAYGEKGDQLEKSVELPALRSFLKSAPKHPRYGTLVDLAATHGTLDSAGRMAGRPNATFLRKILRLEFDRVGDHLVTDPKFAANRYALLGTLECGAGSPSAPALATDFFPDLAGDLPDTFKTLEQDSQPYSGSWIAFYWLLTKRGIAPFDASLSFGDSLNAEGARMPEPNAETGTATEELARTLAARDPKIAALVGADGRTHPSCAVLKALTKSGR